jgi:hypothetical protein
LTNFENVLQSFTSRFPHLVLSITGPWRDQTGTLEREPWIANFKNRTLYLKEIHAGSRGSTMSEALEAGIAFIEANPDSARDYSSDQVGAD